MAIIAAHTKKTTTGKTQLHAVVNDRVQTPVFIDIVFLPAI